MDHSMKEDLTPNEVQKAWQAMDRVAKRYAHDLTGQDGEHEIQMAAQAYCDTQDQHIRDTDPERWSEMQMGC